MELELRATLDLEEPGLDHPTLQRLADRITDLLQEQGVENVAVSLSMNKHENILEVELAITSSDVVNGFSEGRQYIVAAINEAASSIGLPLGIGLQRTSLAAGRLSEPDWLIEPHRPALVAH